MAHMLFLDFYIVLKAWKSTPTNKWGIPIRDSEEQEKNIYQPTGKAQEMELKTVEYDRLSLISLVINDPVFKHDILRILNAFSSTFRRSHGVNGA